MRQFEQRKWDQFFEFVTERDGGIRRDSIAELRADLRHWGVDLDRVESKVADTVKLWRRRDAMGWLNQAKQAQAEFEKRVKAKSDWVSKKFRSAKELWDAIADGSLGPQVQSHAGVFFRNQEPSEHSLEDLQSFLDDCELLGILDKKDPPQS